MSDHEPVATVTMSESMGAEFKFTRPHTLLPGQVLYVYAAPQPQVACPSCGSTQVECAVCAAGFTAPQSQQWVGLTETDLANCDTAEYETARHWERVLREKNGGEA
jgi:hypothetical protein